MLIKKSDESTSVKIFVVSIIYHIPNTPPQKKKNLDSTLDENHPFLSLLTAPTPSHYWKHWTTLEMCTSCRKSNEKLIISQNIQKQPCNGRPLRCGVTGNEKADAPAKHGTMQPSSQLQGKRPSHETAATVGQEAGRRRWTGSNPPATNGTTDSPVLIKTPSLRAADPSPPTQDLT